jgi:hypothetical protein
MGLKYDAMQRIVAALDDAGFDIVSRVPSEPMRQAGELHADNPDAMWRAMLAVSAATLIHREPDKQLSLLREN